MPDLYHLYIVRSPPNMQGSSGIARKISSQTAMLRQVKFPILNSCLIPRTTACCVSLMVTHKVNQTLTQNMKSPSTLYLEHEKFPKILP